MEEADETGGRLARSGFVHSGIMSMEIVESDGASYNANIARYTRDNGLQ